MIESCLISKSSRKQNKEGFMNTISLHAVGHKGRDAMYNRKIHERYYWPNYYKGVEENFASAYISCKAKKKQHVHTQPTQLPVCYLQLPTL